MKTTLIFLMTLLLTTGGCTKEEHKDKKQENPIHNDWSLVKFEDGFSPIEEFANGEIIWSFDLNQKLNVRILEGTSINDKIPLNANGNYNYTINNNQVQLNGNKIFNYEIKSEELILNSLIGLEADGTRISFKKHIKL